MSLAHETATLEEVAAALGRRPSWLKRHWIKLSREEGFPRRLSTGWVWPRRAVEAWLRAGGRIEEGNVQAQKQLDAALLELEAAGKPLTVMASHVGDDFNDLANDEGEEE